MMLHSLNHVAGVHDVDKLSYFSMGSCDMRFALAGGQRVEAYARGKGMCPVCNGEVINVARTESPTGRTGEFVIVIHGPKRKPTGTARGKTTFRPNAKNLSSTMGNPGKSTSLMFVPLMAL